MVKLAPSILAADFLRLGEQLRDAEREGADRFHIDVMDGHFVPNLSMGIPIVEAVRRGSSLPVEAHLMIDQPERYIEDFIHAGADTIIVHQENSPHLHRTVQLVRHLGKKIGVALNPSTPADTLKEILKDLNLVLVMTVNPGFGGQHFIETTLPKIRKMQGLLQEQQTSCELEVDGGIDANTTPMVVEAGAQVLVAGTAVFHDTDGPRGGMRRMKQVLTSSR